MNKRVVEYIDINKIHNDLWDARINPEYSEKDEEFINLKNNIEQNGLYVPINITPQQKNNDDGYYSVVDGRRRFEAMKQLGYREIECFVFKGKTESELAAVTLIQNLHRKDINDVERSRGIAEIFEKVGFPVEQVMTTMKHIHNTKSTEGIDPSLIALWKSIGYSANFIYQILQLAHNLPAKILQYAENKGLTTTQKILLTHTKLRNHPKIQKELVDDLQSTKDIKVSRLIVYQTIRDLETGALYKSGKGYNVHTHLRDKISENQIEYSPYKNYFEIMKHSNNLLRFLTGHQLSKGEYDYIQNHVNYSAQHRIDIVKSLDSRSIVGLMEQLRILRYAIESLESLVAEGANPNI
jgi:ParB/RepB/Spo0J family partition protein